MTEISEFVSIAREAVKTNRAMETSEARKQLAERYTRETERINSRNERGWEDEEGALMTERDEREVNAKMAAIRTSEF